MRIKKALRNLGKNLGLATAIGIASLIPMKAEAGLAGNINYIYSENNKSSQVKTRAFYGLLFGARGFTYTNFYNDGGYFGESFLGKAIKYGIGPKVRIVHVNEPLTQLGTGMEASIPGLPGGISANVNLYPLWFDKNGKLVNKTIVGYSGNASLPHGVKLSSFGGWDVAGGNPKWIYGEIELGKKFGPVDVSYNPALIGDGDAIPTLEHRVAVGVDF